MDLSRVSEISIDFFELYYPREEHLMYLRMDKEHYRLLVHLSSLINNSIILDVGTSVGASALALSQNPTNQILSYDVEHHNIPFRNKIPNIRLIQNDMFAISQEEIQAASLILLDVTPHDGEKERIFFNMLSTYGYKGIVVCDDIHMNKEMKRFWESIGQNKIDVTQYAHFSGTGMVSFNNYS